MYAKMTSPTEGGCDRSPSRVSGSSIGIRQRISDVLASQVRKRATFPIRQARLKEVVDFVRNYHNFPHDRETLTAR